MHHIWTWYSTVLQPTSLNKNKIEMIVEVVLGLVVIWFLIQYFHYGNKPAGSPPGTVGIPIIGILPPRNRTFEEHVNKYRKKYGDTFWLKMGSRNVVFVNEYSDIIAAFNNPTVQGRPTMFSTKLRNIGKERGIALGEGTQWKNLRRFALRRLRDGGMGKSSIGSIILREAEALVDDFENYVGTPTVLPWSINGCILNVTWKLVSDQRYEVDDAEIRKLYNSISHLINQIQSPLFLLLDLMPWLEAITPVFVQDYCGKKECETRIDNIRQLLHKTVKEHKETLDENNPRDLIDYYLIELNNLKKDKADQSDLYSTFSEKELIYLIFDFFTAGSETTSSTIRWYLLLMAKYPEVQKQVHEELDNVLSRDTRVSLEDKPNLPFFEATINETLRLKQIAPFGTFHTVTDDTTIDGYLIPKGTYVLANLQACNRHPKFWKKPNEFYPEHFLNEDKTFNHETEGLLTFSTGRRVCPGENLARMDLFFVLATLLQKFSFTAPEGETLSIDRSPDQPFFTIPKPFKLIINKR